jgi:hypothetical protein
MALSSPHWVRSVRRVRQDLNAFGAATDDRFRPQLLVRACRIPHGVTAREADSLRESTL